MESWVGQAIGAATALAVVFANDWLRNRQHAREKPREWLLERRLAAMHQVVTLYAEYMAHNMPDTASVVSFQQTDSASQLGSPERVAQSARARLKQCIEANELVLGPGVLHWFERLAEAHSTLKSAFKVPGDHEIEVSLAWATLLVRFKNELSQACDADLRRLQFFFAPVRQRIDEARAGRQAATTELELVRKKGVGEYLEMEL